MNVQSPTETTSHQLSATKKCFAYVKLRLVGSIMYHDKQALKSQPSTPISSKVMRPPLPLKNSTSY